MKIRLNKPAKLQEALALASADAQKNGMAFTMGGTHGTVSGHGFEGHYEVYSDHILLTVTRKLFLVSSTAVVNEATKYWARICARANEAITRTSYQNNTNKERR